MKFLLVLIGCIFVAVQGFPPLLHGPLGAHVKDKLINRIASRSHNKGQDDTCPSWKDRQLAKPGKLFCCDSTIKTVVETGMKTLDLFGAGGPQTLGPIVQTLSSFIQRHFKVAYEVVMAPKEFVLNTNYNGTKLCKFQSNSYTLAVYETPEYYDINGPGEAYFYNFAANDKLHIPSVSEHLKKFGGLANTATGGLSGSAGSLAGSLGGWGR